MFVIWYLENAQEMSQLWTSLLICNWSWDTRDTVLMFRCGPVLGWGDSCKLWEEPYSLLLSALGWLRIYSLVFALYSCSGGTLAQHASPIVETFSEQSSSVVSLLSQLSTATNLNRPNRLAQRRYPTQPCWEWAFVPDLWEWPTTRPSRPHLIAWSTFASMALHLSVPSSPHSGTHCEPRNKGYLELKDRISLDSTWSSLQFSFRVIGIISSDGGAGDNVLSWLSRQQHLGWELETLRKMRVLRILWQEPKWHYRAMQQGLGATSQNSLDSFLRMLKDQFMALVSKVFTLNLIIAVLQWFLFQWHFSNFPPGPSFEHIFYVVQTNYISLTFLAGPIFSHSDIWLSS